MLVRQCGVICVVIIHIIITYVILRIKRRRMDTPMPRLQRLDAHLRIQRRGFQAGVAGIAALSWTNTVPGPARVFRLLSLLPELMRVDLSRRLLGAGQRSL
ncbi:hypothetical protein SJI19_05825 [Acerihabitans sp. TG2]|uniref:hypothetical protein n=1 Tax=Acerihabitans sp. TG2 TaxID=3096008 RepID=UPI002B23393B|nr:hypothetical protein [Acerihabitans sp. TG2]MEA9390073.1 hypothetical protein [Acerihabitans sp. TG2]